MNEILSVFIDAKCNVFMSKSEKSVFTIGIDNVNMIMLPSMLEEVADFGYYLVSLDEVNAEKIVDQPYIELSFKKNQE